LIFPFREGAPFGNQAFNGLLPENMTCLDRSSRASPLLNCGLRVRKQPEYQTEWDSVHALVGLGYSVFEEAIFGSG
jgi:hypothetical protein